jgi:cytochrome oxidase Cu insertion factor (SCO1/SenC/PrrC family)
MPEVKALQPMFGAKRQPARGSVAAPMRRQQHRTPSAFWAIMILLGVSAGIGLVLFHVARGSNIAGAVAGPDMSWAAGSRRAPNFHLHDQNGRPVSLTRYRGHPVIVTFIDPLCRNLCPIEAGILNKAVKRLPSSDRPTIVAVSVNPSGDGRANLLEDMKKWRLSTTWRWAVGSPKELAAVWRHYEIGVSTTTQTFAGVRVREVNHTEASFVVDSAGFQRALYVFPFAAADIAATVRRLAV